MGDYEYDYEYDPCILIQSKDACEPSSTPDPSSWNKCYWDSSDNTGPKCKNRCAVRETKGQCEQFYDKNQSRISNTIYNFDGKEHHCKWYPSYYNIDITAESTDGKCRDAIPSTASQADLSNKFKGVNLTDYKETEPVYCGYNKVLDTEDMCIKLKADDEDNKCAEHPSCEPTIKPRRAVSDGNMIYDQNGKLDYMDSEQCKDEYNASTNPTCPKGCICMPTSNYCKAKPINLIDPIDTNYPSCIPLQAQIPGNYDINLLEEEGRDIRSYSSQTNIDPPYFTSKYLCDICHIRNEEIIKKKKNGDPNNPDFTPENYCNKKIDKNNRQPCKWIDDIDKCVSRCNLTEDETGIHENEPITNEILKNKKEECSKKYQFYEEYPDADVIFPNLNDYNQETEDDYYKEMYCSWDGFECHNSIPCKYAQRINCEDNKYDWYEIHADDEVITDTKQNVAQLNYPVRRDNKGNPIYGDMEGVCVEPNTKDIYRGNPPEYVLKNKYRGEHGILLIWSETGTPWWNGDTEQQYLGENVIFIPFTIAGGDNLIEITADIIKKKINDALNGYYYYAMNGKSVVWARDIFDWCEKEGRGFFKRNDSPLTPYDKDKFNKSSQYYTGDSFNDTELQNTYTIMNRVIYDLRGTINLIPTNIDKIAKINIQTFTISPQSGKITFKMTQDNQGQFHFLRFLEQDTDTDNENNYKWQNLELHMYHKYIHIFTENFVTPDESNPPLYPKSIGHGYGSLYEYIRPTTSIQYNNNTETSIDNLTTAIKNYNDNNDNILDIITNLKKVIDELKEYKYIENNASYNQLIDIKKCFLKEGKEGEEGLTFISGKDKGTNEFKQAFVYNLKKWMEKEMRENKYRITAYRITAYGIKELLKRGYHLIAGEKILCSGSIESYDNHIKTLNLKSTRITITMNKLTPLVRLMKLHNKNLQSGATENLFPNDLRDSALWSMTRNTHPFFGDLIYEGVTDGVFINESGGDISLDDGYKDIYRKHLLIPFRSTNEEDPGNDFIDWKVIMTYLGGNCNKIIRHMDLAPPSPINWGTMLTNNPSLLKANTIDKNRYYEQTYIDYINLTPNNPCMNYVFNYDVNEYIIHTTPNPKIGELNKHIIKNPKGDRTGAMDDKDAIDTFRDYYIPGKWLDPFKKEDKFGWHFPFSEGDKTYIEGETHPELQKLKNVCFPANPYIDPTPFKHDKGDGDYYWPQTGKQIENCTYLNQIFYENQEGKPPYGLPQAPGVETKLYQTGGVPRDQTDRRYSPHQPVGGWHTGEERVIHTNGGFATFKPLSDKSVIQATPTKRLDCAWRWGTITEMAFTPSFNECWGWQSQRNEDHPNLAYYMTSGLFNDMKTSDEKGEDFSYNGEDTNCLGLKENPAYIDTDGVSQRRDALSLPSSLNIIRKCQLYFMTKEQYSDVEQHIGGEEEGGNSPYNYWKKYCGVNFVDSPTDKPLGFESLDIPATTHVSPLPLPSSISSNLNINKINNPHGQSQGFIREETSKLYAKPSLDVTNVNKSLYPSWVVDNSNELQTCSNLLSYVPVIPTDTIPTISLDNCSLPVLTDEATSTADLLTNTLSRFINSAEKDNAQTIRRICPETCQAVQCPKIPEISGNDLISFQLFTINNTNIKNYPLKEIPEEANYNNNINYGDDFWYKLYQNPLFVSSLSIIRTPAQNPMKYLFTKSGMVTDINNSIYCKSKQAESEYDIEYINIATPYSLPSCANPSKQNIPNKLNSIQTVITALGGKINADCQQSLYQLYLNKSYDELCPSKKPDPSQFENLKCGVGNISETFCNNVKNEMDEDTPWTHFDVDNIDIRTITNNSLDVYRDDGKCGNGTDYIKLLPMKNNSGDKELFETFKPPKDKLQSHIFRPGDEYYEYHYGCVPKNMITWPPEYFKLNCNTNTSYPIQRDKYVMINYIIQHSKDKSLNISDRTKLAMMNEEELIEKAGELGITLDDLNKYTKPKLISHVKDITGQDGKFEKWNDLEQYYLNIDDNVGELMNDKLPKLGVKQWDYEGCSLDFNNALQKKSFESCKDKYPGLCKKHVDKCTDNNENIRKAIRTDCPETCGVQFSDFDDFKKEQSGILSICTDRGRCKWSGDQDDSNLLPFCEKKNAREYGNSNQCESALKIPSLDQNGLFIEGCEGKSDPNCNEKRCHSFLGCEYYKGNNSVCHIKNEASDQIINNRQCSQVGGQWVGTSETIGQCILPERFDYNLPKEQCIGNTRSWIPQTQEACLFNPHTWTPLEDPCGLPDDIDCFKVKDPNRCTSMSQCHLSNPTTDTINNPSMNICVPNSIKDMDESDIQNQIGDMYKEFKNDKITEIKPACTEENKEKCKNNEITPDAFELTMEEDIPELYEGDYIYITRKDNSESCSQFITGYSKVIQINRGTPLKIYIKGPNTPYTLDIGYDGKYDMGKCYITTYIKSYANKDVNSHIESCTNSNRKGSCTMYTPVDNDETSPYCKSCSLIGDRSSCIIDNKTSLCGWGEVEDICNVLGNIKECNDMYVEGCMWDRTKEQCVINQERDDDGDKSRTPMGCMKCDNIKHNHACNSLANCFWDNKTEGATGICRACSEFDTKDSCNNKSSRKCNFNEDKNRCESAQLYPLIYEWIWYNRWYLISLIVCIYLAWKLPEIVGTILRKSKRAPGFIVSIGVFIVRCILIFVTIPALLVYPGLTPADGKEGRNVYRDPPLDPKNIGYFDFLLGGSKNDYALWPARLYDERWDDVIMDDNYLRDMVDLRISKNSLDWTGYIKSFGVSWNKFMNSMGNTNSALGVMFLLVQTIIFIIYTLFNYFANKKNIIGSKFLEINIVISIGLLVGLKILFNSIENTSTKINEYDGRELDNPYSEDSLLHNFYYIGSDSEKKICPYGCMVKVDNGHKICRDNRSVFSLRGILDPDKKLDWINDPTKVKNIQEWIYNKDGSICPPAKIPWRWPYDSLCNDFREKCVSNIVWATYPESDEFVKEKIKNKADEKCEEYKQNNNNTCLPKNKTLSITANTYSNDIFDDNPNHIKEIAFTCEKDDLEPDNCPFPGPPFILSNTDPFEQRKDINVWSYLYDKIAGPSPRRRIPPPSKQTWQNEERYEIVNQNFTNDKLFR